MNLFYNTTRFFYILFLLFGFVLGQAQNQITLPYTESFEDGLGDFTHDSTDDFNWTRNSGGTPSPETGPGSASSGTYYMYTEVSGIGTNDVANLLFDPFEVDSAVVNAFVRFQYHMRKTNLSTDTTFGSLALQVQESNGTWTTLWSKNEHQSNDWLTAEIDISNYLGSAIHLRFQRVRGSSNVGDAAIDLFQIGGEEGLIFPPTINGADIAFDVSLNTTTGNVDWTTRFTKEMTLPTVAEFLATKALRVGSSNNIVTADSGELLSIRYGETDGSQDRAKLVFEIDVPEDESNYLVRMQYNDTGHDNSGLTDLDGTEIELSSGAAWSSFLDTNLAPVIGSTLLGGTITLNTSNNAEWITRFNEEMALPTVTEFLATKALRVGSATNIVTADSGELLSIRYGETDGSQDRAKLVFEIDVPAGESNYQIRMQYGDTGHDNSGLTDLAGNAFAGSNASNGFVDTTALSIDDPALRALVLYPNPVTNHLHIESPLAEAMSYTVYDLTGKALSTHHKTGQTHSIDVSGLAKGVYLLEATHNNNTAAMQFVKE